MPVCSLSPPRENSVFVVDTSIKQQYSVTYVAFTCFLAFKRHIAVSSESLFCTGTLSFFVLSPEPKMEAERGSVVKTAYGMVTAIL